MDLASSAARGCNPAPIWSVPPRGVMVAEPLSTLSMGNWQMHSGGNRASSYDYLFLPEKDLVHWVCCWETSVYTSVLLVRYHPGGVFLFYSGKARLQRIIHVSVKRCKVWTSSQVLDHNKVWFSCQGIPNSPACPPRIRLHGSILLSLHSKAWNLKNESHSDIKVAQNTQYYITCAYA